MTDTITLTGLVATEPRQIVTSEGLAISSFRLASTQRRFDKTEGRWMDGDTNWYTITAFRQLALNVSASVRKGERIVVTGRLKVRAWDNGERTGTNIDIEADAVGHDLAWGTTAFNRTILVSSGAEPTDPEGPSVSSEQSGNEDATADDTALALDRETESTPVPF